MQHKIVMALIALSMAIRVVAQTPLSAKISAKTQPISKEVELKSNANALTLLLKPRTGATKEAQKPFIKHFWELGDGSFTTEERPQYGYIAAGNPKARLFMTPCYTLDNILPDSQTLVASKTTVGRKTLTNNDWQGTMRLTSNLTLHRLKAVRANDVFVAIASVRNALSNARNAKLFIFYNKIDQVKTKGRVLILKDTRLYGTTEGVFSQELSTINGLKKAFYDVKTFNISNLDKNDRNLFMTFEVLQKEEFEKMEGLDIVAALVMDGSPNVEQSLLHFQTASSFDPNNIKAPGTMSFRNINNKTFKYRINFENVGNSAATSVKVKTDIPDALDAYSIHNIKMTPTFKTTNNRDSAMKYTINPDGKFITFDFKNIDISGAKEDWSPKKKDTQGFVEYELKPKEGIKKRTLESGAEIIFDQNAPIITDKDRTPFRTGISLGVKAGMNYQPNTEGSNYFIGATYSAYRQAGFYLQIEAMVDLNKRTTAQDSFTQAYYKLPNTAQDARLGYTPTKDSFSFQEKYNRTNAIRIVPVQLRYDVSRFLSIGLGVNADVTFTTFQQFQTPTLVKYRYSQLSTAILTTSEICNFGRQQVVNKSETKLDFGAFGDVSLGNFSRGLSLGLRAMQPFTLGGTASFQEVVKPKPKMAFQIYLSYKVL